jgi:hypothetical protein
MANNKQLDIADALEQLLNKASKQRNATMYMYYKQIQNDPNIIAFSSFEIFKESWAYHQWYNNHKNVIYDFIVNEHKRFGNIWSAE